MTKVCNLKARLAAEMEKVRKGNLVTYEMLGIEVLQLLGLSSYDKFSKADAKIVVGFLKEQEERGNHFTRYVEKNWTALQKKTPVNQDTPAVPESTHPRSDYPANSEHLSLPDSVGAQAPT